jgi:hypothetical protein
MRVDLTGVETYRTLREALQRHVRAHAKASAGGESARLTTPRSTP